MIIVMRFYMKFLDLLVFLLLKEADGEFSLLVLLLHGLGGSSRRIGLRRMAFSFLSAGFGVLRVNLRGGLGLLITHERAEVVLEAEMYFATKPSLRHQWQAA